MTKLTGGPGWALVPDEGPKPSRPENPRSPQPQIRLEKRAGKKVTVIAGLHADRLNAIAREIKTMCGAIEIQGDNVARVQAWFRKQR